MNIEMLTEFFMWCSIINGGLLTLWSLIFWFAPKIVYKTQSKLFPIPEEQFTVIFYKFIGYFKMIFLVFNLVPYVALLIIG